MALVTESAETIFAPFDIAGNPRGADMGKAQRWGMELERFVGAAATNAAIFETRAELYAALNYDANASGYVLGDATAAYNGWYRKLGASGSGSWVRRGDLPYSWISMTDLGAGTANAIQVTSVLPTSPSVRRTVKIFETNTGAVTISENGAAAKPLVTASGNAIAAGGLPAGTVLDYFDDGTAFRLLSDQASAAVLAGAEDAASRAEGAAEDAEYWAGQAVLAGTIPVYASAAAISSITVPGGLSAFATQGYSSTGDGGRANYRRFVAETELAAIVAAYPESLPKKKQWAINNVLRRLKAGGVWSKLSLLVDFGGLALASSSAGLINWKAPSTALVASGGPTYTAGLGFTGDGVDASISAGAWNTLAGGLDSSHLGIWLTTNANGRGKINNDFAAGASGGVYIRPNYNGKVRSVVNHTTALDTGDVVGRLGHTVVNRSGAGALEVYRDGRQVGSGTTASTSVVTAPLTFLSYATAYSTDTIGWAHAGASLTALEVDLIYDVMMEFRHIIEWDADPAKLIQDASGAWFELDLNGEVNLYQYGARGNNLTDDTQAWIDACALRQKVSVPQPLVAYRVEDDIPVRAHVQGDWAKVNLTIATLNARGFWPQHKSKLKGLDISRTLNLLTTVGGDRHNAVLVGQFHDDQRPFHDIVVDVRIRDEGAKRHNLFSILGDVKNGEFSAEITGDSMSLGMLTHWGSVYDDSAVQQTIQRPRDLRFPKIVHRNRVTGAGYGIYLSGPVNFAFGTVLLEKCSYGGIIAAGDLNESYDLASNNEAVGRLMSGITFENVSVIDPIFRGFWVVGRSDIEGGTRWYATDPASNPSMEIGTFNLVRGPSTQQGNAIYGELWKNLRVHDLTVTNKPGVSSTVADLTHPALYFEGCRDIDVKGATRVRAGARLVSGARIKIDLDAQNNRATESTSASFGVKASGANTAVTIVNAVAIGDTSVVLASVPCHICPGMAFEVGGNRYHFAGSAASGLGDTNVTIAIEPAVATISAGTAVAILNGVSDVDVLGTYRGFYYGFHADSAYNKVPCDIRLNADIKDSTLDGARVTEGELIRVVGGVFDRNNRSNNANGRDIRIDATGKVYDVTGVVFSPSPGSRLTRHHVYVGAGASGVSVIGNKFFGAVTAATSIPANGADGVANIVANNWTGP